MIAAGWAGKTKKSAYKCHIDLNCCATSPLRVSHNISMIIRPRFSLWLLLLVVTAVGIALGLYRASWNYPFDRRPGEIDSKVLKSAVVKGELLVVLDTGLDDMVRVGMTVRGRSSKGVHYRGMIINAEYNMCVAGLETDEDAIVLDDGESVLVDLDSMGGNKCATNGDTAVSDACPTMRREVGGRATGY